MSTQQENDERLNNKLHAAQQELAAIKQQYSTMPVPSNGATNIVKAAAFAVQATPMPPSTLTTTKELDSIHPAQQQLAIAEGVMLKLYKKNLALEHQIRQLTTQLKQVTSSTTVSTTASTTASPTTTSSTTSSTAPSMATVQTVPPVTTTSSSNNSNSSNNNNNNNNNNDAPSTTTSTTSAPPTIESHTQIKTLQDELNVQRASCARFAAQNGALRSDFTRLAQQQIQPLLNSSSVGHATQEVLSLLAATLQRFETERAAEVKNYTARLKESEEARIELSAQIKFLSKGETTRVKE
jgi:hypothetical protein